MVAGQQKERPPESVADPLLPGSIAGALGNARIGASVHYEDRVDSTNCLAREIARRGCVDGQVVIAETQTAGRGRRQRSWVSPAGKGIYVSVVLRPEAAAADAGPAVQLVAGIAVAESLAIYADQQLTLRWPNDCYCGARKLAGVLAEAAVTGNTVDYVVCGVGVNVSFEEEDFPPDLRAHATSLSMLSGNPQSRLPVMVSLLRALEQWDDVWRRQGMGPIIQRWLELSPESRGSYVEVRTDSGWTCGVADGLSPTGALYVEDELKQRHEITVGELVRLSPTPSTSETQRRTP